MQKGWKTHVFKQEGTSCNTQGAKIRQFTWCMRFFSKLYIFAVLKGCRIAGFRRTQSNDMSGKKKKNITPGEVWCFTQHRLFLLVYTHKCTHASSDGAQPRRPYWLLAFRKEKKKKESNSDTSATATFSLRGTNCNAAGATRHWFQTPAGHLLHASAAQSSPRSTRFCC